MNKLLKMFFNIIIIYTVFFAALPSPGRAENQIAPPKDFVIGEAGFSSQPVTTPSTTLRLPIGMNIPSVTYYDPTLMFNDVMKTSNYRANGINKSDLSSSKFINFPKDVQGYPTEVPYTIEGYQYEYIAYINSFYSGEYALLYDGEGQVSINGISSSFVNGIRRFTLPGIKTNIWVRVASVTSGNHVRNIRIIPVEYIGKEEVMPTFRTDFISGLKPFHSFRAMDLTMTNSSTNIEWADRTKKDSITQGGNKGIAWEYVIELANQLDQDPWICTPHQASDDYITNMAQLFKDTLEPDRKIYLEFSNEVWNWTFPQAGYVLNNAPGHPNSYVSAGLSAIAAPGSNHPEKDAYMMARTFRIFAGIFGSQMNRVVRTASSQHGWPDNSRRILKYLFETDGIGADALAVGGYFNYNSADHAAWNAMDPASVTPEMILQSAKTRFPENEAKWTRDTAVYTKQYGVDYLVYEGGQHMQPYQQGEWPYNHAVYDAQIHPGMYELYKDNFSVLSEPGVNCKLFAAFSYMGPRQSRYGSWGHLENMSQLSSPETLMNNAPKYKALLDFNASR